MLEEPSSQVPWVDRMGEVRAALFPFIYGESHRPIPACAQKQLFVRSFASTAAHS
jgi:hypothetical protein